MSVTTARKSSILIVDDAPENLDILKGALKADYIVRIANSGRLALRIAAHVPAPDLILLDIMMPDMDGYEVMRQLRANQATRDIPVIFVTAMSEVIDELKGLSLGAVDYITKPFSVPIIQARVRTHLALREAQAIVQAQAEQLLHERDLIEEVILQMRDASDFDGRRIRHISSSVDKTNGDVLFAAFTPDGRQIVLIGDIAGHGPAAAVSIPLISQTFYDISRQGGSAAGLLAELNAVMFSKLPAMIYMPYCLVEISADRRGLTLWNGGLPGSVLIESDGRRTPFTSTTFPLGVSADIFLDGSGSQFADLADGARLWLFTDGLTELPDVSGRHLGMKGIIGIISKFGPADDLSAIWPQLVDYHGGEDFPDDITLVELRR